MRLYEEHGKLTAQRASESRRSDALLLRNGSNCISDIGLVGGRREHMHIHFYGEFHAHCSPSCLPRGTAELVRVAAGDKIIGYVYNFIYNGWVCAYQTGLEYGSDPKLKPGLVAHYLCIERHLSEGAHCYDFLAGDSRYKRSFGTPGPDMLELVLQRPIAKLRIESALREVKRTFTHTTLEG